MIPLPTHTLPHTGFPFAEGSLPPFEHPLDFRAFSSLRRMVNHQQGKPLVRRADFIKQMTLFLPEVAARIEESDFGFVHLEVGAMRIATLDAFARSDFASVRRHMQLAADLFDRADAELYDAIRVSWLEALFLGETSAAHIAARGMLSRPMENALRQAELRLEKRQSVQA